MSRLYQDRDGLTIGLIYGYETLTNATFKILPFQEDIMASSLEEENTVLHLRNAKLCSELKSRSERVTYLQNKVADLNRQKQTWRNRLSQAQKDIEVGYLCLRHKLFCYLNFY